MMTGRAEAATPAVATIGSGAKMEEEEATTMTGEEAEAEEDSSTKSLSRLTTVEGEEPPDDPAGYTSG